MTMGTFGDTAAAKLSVLIHNVELLTLIPGFIGVHLNPQGRSQHGGGQVLGKITGLPGVLTETMVLRDISIVLFSGWAGKPDSRRYQATGLIGTLPGHNYEGDLAGKQIIQPFGFRNDFAIGGKNAGNGDQITFLNPGIPQSDLEALQLIAMMSDAPGKEHSLGYDFFQSLPPFNFFLGE
jgi:hypothetical protein